MESDQEKGSVNSFYDAPNEDRWESERAEKIRSLAKTEIFFAAIAISISSFILACRPCGTQQSAGSGVWCSVYFLLVGFMCLGKDGTLSSTIMLIFGGVGVHFAILMLVVEGIETSGAFGNYPPNYIGATGHVILCVIAFAELALMIGTMYLHSGKKPSKKKLQDSDKFSSTDDFVLARV